MAACGMASEVNGFKSCSILDALACDINGSCNMASQLKAIKAATGMAIEILPKMATNCVRIILIIKAASSAICAILEPLRCCTVEANAAAVIAGCLVATVKCKT